MIKSQQPKTIIIQNDKNNVQPKHTQNESISNSPAVKQKQRFLFVWKYESTTHMCQYIQWNAQKLAIKMKRERCDCVYVCVCERYY